MSSTAIAKPKNKVYSPNPEINAVILELLEQHLPPLPVAPAQDPKSEGNHQIANPHLYWEWVNRNRRQWSRSEDWGLSYAEREWQDEKRPEQKGPFCKLVPSYVMFRGEEYGETGVKVPAWSYCPLDEKGAPHAKFTGKNPSFLDRNGKARTLNHHTYQKRLPTERELRDWFANDSNGIGTLGGWQVEGFTRVYVDYDAKNFSSQEECDRYVLGKWEELGRPWLAATGSGGYRLPVDVEESPTFTNFDIDESGEHHYGEALGSGRFTVLPPSKHPKGTYYRCLSNAAVARVKRLEDIGIYPTKAEKSNAERRAKRGNNTVAVPTDPASNPWDIRNLIPYVTGYHNDGSRLRCQCPVHLGVTHTSLSVNPETGAFHCWSGCETQSIYAECKRIAIASGYSPSPLQTLKKSLDSELPDYSLTYAPTIEFNSEKFGAVKLQPDWRFIGVKGPKGSGKTELLVKWIDTALENGQPVYILTHRANLGRQLAGRTGVIYREDAITSEEGTLLGYVLCWHSAHLGSAVPFSGKGKGNAFVIVDEIESFTVDLLNSEIARSNRLPIMRELKELLTGVLSPDSLGKFAGLDADLSDTTVNAWLKWGERTDLQPTIILNSYANEGKAYKVYSYQKPEHLAIAMFDSIQSDRDAHHMILTTSQDSGSKWSTQTVEAEIKRRFPGEAVLRVDAKTIADPSHQAFNCFESPAIMHDLFKRHKFLILSPVGESGLSIELYKFYKRVWAFDTGLLAENSVRQFLARCRDFSVERHCYFAERGLPNSFIGNGETDWRELLRTENQKAVVNCQAISHSGVELDLNGSLNGNTAMLECWAKLGARHNLGQENHRAAIISGLIGEGCEVVQVELAATKEEVGAVLDAVEAARDVNRKHEAEAIAAAQELTKEEYEKLKEQRSKTAAENFATRRYELSDRYCVPVTPELATKDADGWYPHLRLHYYLDMGAKFLPNRERNKVKDITDIQGQFWLPDLNKVQISHKIALLQELQIDRFIALVGGSGEAVHKNHPMVQAIASKAREYAGYVKDFLGIQITPSNGDIAIVQNLLASSIGFRLVKGERAKGTGGDRIQKYYYEVPGDEREKVFSAWLQRDLMFAGITPESQLDLDSTRNDYELGSPKPLYIYIRGLGDPNLVLGDPVECSHGKGTVEKIDGDWVRVEGESFLAWHLISRVTPLTEARDRSVVYEPKPRKARQPKQVTAAQKAAKDITEVSPIKPRAKKLKAATEATDGVKAGDRVSVSSIQSAELWESGLKALHQAEVVAIAPDGQSASVKLVDGSTADYPVEVLKLATAVEQRTEFDIYKAGDRVTLRRITDDFTPSLNRVQAGTEFVIEAIAYSDVFGQWTAVLQPNGYGIAYIPLGWLKQSRRDASVTVDELANRIE